jgi:signal transduction histidine kinase/CheY-like chemotaxis protein
MNNQPWNKLARNFVSTLNFKSLIRYIFLSMMLFLSVLIFSTQISSMMFALKGEAQTTSVRILDSLSEKLLSSLVTGDYELAQEVIDTSINDVNIADVKLIITDKLTGEMITITPKHLSEQTAFAQWLVGYAPSILSDLALPTFNADVKPTIYQAGDFSGFDVDGIGRLELILDFSDVLFRQGVILVVAVVFLIFCFLFMLSICNNIDENVTYPLDDLLAATRQLIATNFISAPRIMESNQPEIAELINHFQKLSEVIVERNAELNELLMNRERVIEERTSDLWKALAEAKQSAQSKSNFINIMSHELNQPLFNARMAVMNMSRNPKLFGNQTVDHYCAIINQHLDNARGQIEHVLEFTGKGKQSYTPKSEVFDFYDLVESLMVSHACAAAAKGLYIDLIVAPHFPNNIVSCPDGWRQILNNFIGNAIKFTEKGGVVIQISAKEFINAGEFTLQVEVVDTGIGIAAEDIEKIFEYYTQAGDATRRRQGGYGIGLGIVDNYVKALGGKRGVISSPEGSTFSVEIPVDRSTKTLGQVQATCIAMINKMRLFFILFDERESWRLALQSRIHNVSAHCLATDSLIEAMSIISRQGNSHTVVCVGRTGTTSLLVQHLDKLRAANPRLLIGMDFSIDHESSVEDQAIEIDLRLSGHIDMRDFMREIHDIMSNHQTVEAPRPLLESSQSLHGKRLLLVDDNQSNLDYTREFLMSYGAHVDTAHGPQQGLDMAATEPYDAIFLDVMMPVINGIEVGSRIRMGNVNSNSALFAFTAGRLDDDMLAELNALGMHLLLKMDAREKLVKSIIDVLYQPGVSSF